MSSPLKAESIPTKSLLIDGQPVAAGSGKTFQSLSPADQTPLANIPHASLEDAETAVQAARSSFTLGSWRNSDGAMRAKILNKIADLIEANLEEFAQLEAADQGKPVGFARLLEIPAVVDCFRYFAGWTDRITGQTIPVPMSGLDFTLREPVGVCVGLAPNNYPLALAAFKVAPALAAGNSFILKPSPSTPLTALRLGEICLEAGLPDGVLNVLTEPTNEVAAYLLEHPEVDLVSLTGGTETGKAVMRGAASTLKHVSLELGGKSPMIVFPDVDLDLAVTGAMLGVFYNSGQTCTASTRIFVHESIHDEFVERFAARASAVKVGHPLDDATQNGPVVTRQQLEKVKHYIGLGDQEGAIRVCGGEFPQDPGLSAEGNYISPTIFSNVSNSMKIARDEIFGPVAAVLKFSDEYDVLDQANDSPYGLAASIWTNDIKRALNFAKNVQAGQVWINNHNAFFPHTPFGGYKKSGIGREGGYDVLLHYTQVKNVYVELGDIIMSPF